MDSIDPLWNTVAGGVGHLAVEGASGAGTYLTGGAPSNLFDNRTNTRFVSRGNSTSGSNSIAGLNTGFHLTIAECRPTLVQFRFATGDAERSRDPINLTVEGTDCDDLLLCTSWTLIYSGTSGLENVTTTGTYGEWRNITSATTPYASYRFLVTSKRNTTASTFVTYGEVQLFGY
jgi:hypothetical protein